MEEDLKKLIIEIITLTLLLVIAIPICVNASNKYQESKAKLVQGAKTSIDITNQGDTKKVTIYTNSDKKAKINLILKINKLSDQYLIHLNDQIYELNKIESTEDEDYQYYNLGIYEIDGQKELDFKIEAKDKIYYDETLTYSFIAEGLI